MDLSQLTEAVELLSPYISLVGVCGFFTGVAVVLFIDFITTFIDYKIRKLKHKDKLTLEEKIDIIDNNVLNLVTEFHTQDKGGETNESHSSRHT